MASMLPLQIAPISTGSVTSQHPTHPASRRTTDSEHLHRPVIHHGPSKSKKGLGAALVQVASLRWQNLRGAVGAVVRAQGLAAADRAAFTSAARDAIAHASSGGAGVTLTVENEKDLATINYLRQGNSDAYTDSAVAARLALRSDPEVVEAIRDWWKWVPKQDRDTGRPARLHAHRESETSAPGDPAQLTPGVVDLVRYEKEGVPRHVYFAMVVAIQMVLLPKYGMEADEAYDPSEDWEADARGDTFMHYPAFFDALFELADMWCDSLAPTDYAALLRKLLDEVKEGEAAQGTFSALLAKWAYRPSAEWLRAYSAKLAVPVEEGEGEEEGGDQEGEEADEGEGEEGEDEGEWGPGGRGGGEDEGGEEAGQGQQVAEVEEGEEATGTTVVVRPQSPVGPEPALTASTQHVGDGEVEEEEECVQGLTGTGGGEGMMVAAPSASPELDAQVVGEEEARAQLGSPCPTARSPQPPGSPNLTDVSEDLRAVGTWGHEALERSEEGAPGAGGGELGEERQVGAPSDVTHGSAANGGNAAAAAAAAAAGARQWVGPAAADAATVQSGQDGSPNVGRAAARQRGGQATHGSQNGLPPNRTRGPQPAAPPAPSHSSDRTRSPLFPEPLERGPRELHEGRPPHTRYVPLEHHQGPVLHSDDLPNTMLSIAGGQARLGVVAFGSPDAHSSGYTNSTAGQVGVQAGGMAPRTHLAGFDSPGMASNRLWYEQYMQGVIQKHYGLQPGAAINGTALAIPGRSHTEAGLGGSSSAPFTSPSQTYSCYFHASPLHGLGPGAVGHRGGAGGARRAPGFQQRAQPLSPPPQPMLDGLALLGRGAGRPGPAPGPHEGGAHTLSFSPPPMWGDGEGEAGGRGVLGAGRLARQQRPGPAQQGGYFWVDPHTADAHAALSDGGLGGHGVGSSAPQLHPQSKHLVGVGAVGGGGGAGTVGGPRAQPHGSSHWQSAASPPRRNPRHVSPLSRRAFPMYGQQYAVLPPKGQPSYLQVGSLQQYAQMNRSYPPGAEMARPAAPLQLPAIRSTSSLHSQWPYSTRHNGVGTDGGFGGGQGAAPAAPLALAHSSSQPHGASGQGPRTSDAGGGGGQPSGRRSSLSEFMYRRRGVTGGTEGTVRDGGSAGEHASFASFVARSKAVMACARGPEAGQRAGPGGYWQSG